VSITRTLAAFAGYGLLAAASLAAPQTAQASPAVSLDSAIFIERQDQGARRLEPVSELNRGDRVIYVVTWQRSTGSGPFTVTNPLPRQVAFQGSANGDEQVSVDGGHSWGRIGELRSGARLATPEDVTHVRWQVPADLAARGSGRIAYSAIVR
jgi:hypothetical protein